MGTVNGYVPFNNIYGTKWTHVLSYNLDNILYVMTVILSNPDSGAPYDATVLTHFIPSI